VTKDRVKNALISQEGGKKFRPTGRHAPAAALPQGGFARPAALFSLI